MRKSPCRPKPRCSLKSLCPLIRIIFHGRALATAIILLTGSLARAAPVVVHVRLGATVGAPVSGRLLIFATPLAAAKAAAHGGPIIKVEATTRHPDAAVAAQEVPHLATGETIEVDADLSAFPRPFSKLEPGRYAVQALLDVGHDYNYAGRNDGDLISPVTEMDLPAGGDLSLDAKIPASMPRHPIPTASGAQLAAYPLARDNIRPIDFQSPVMSRFYGRPIHLRGWILLPPGYDRNAQRYPVVYSTLGYGGTLAFDYDYAVRYWREMHDGAIPPMIWVLLDQSLPTAAHYFVDSLNTGPWGEALTTELIPELERVYRMDGTANGRFLTGHSAGGAATLWLQVRYPKIFGGTWSSAPGLGDFHDLLGIDLYAPHANFYRRPDGMPIPLLRQNGAAATSMEQFVKLETVLDPTCGHFTALEWAFSPRGPLGAPVPLFDRNSGVIDPSVATYWHDHGDIAPLLRREWPTLKPDLDAKFHVFVGIQDDFYSDGAAHRLDAVFRSLGAHEDFSYLPGRGHFNLYSIGNDPDGLTRVIAWAMYLLARPDTKPPAGLPDPTKR